MWFTGLSGAGKTTVAFHTVVNLTTCSVLEDAPSGSLACLVPGRRQSPLLWRSTSWPGAFQHTDQMGITSGDLTYLKTTSSDVTNLKTNSSDVTNLKTTQGDATNQRTTSRDVTNQRTTSGDVTNSKATLSDITNLKSNSSDATILKTT